MDNKTRIFYKTDSHHTETTGRIEVLKLKDDEIETGATFDDYLRFSVKKDDVYDLKNYECVNDEFLKEEYLKTHIIFTEDDLSTIENAHHFINILREYLDKKNFQEALNNYNEYDLIENESPITMNDITKIIEYIEKEVPLAIDWVNTFEFHEYWNGSNWNIISLSGEYSDFQEVDDEEEYNDFIEEERLDDENKGTYKEKLIITKSNKKAIVSTSFYQGEITSDWEFIEDDNEDEENKIKTLKDFHIKYQK
jgi:hypothetical protein